MLRECLEKTVLLNEVINGLSIIANGVYVDGTFGCGGHSRAILSYLGHDGRLFAIDRDYSAVSIGEVLSMHDKRFTMIYGRFSRLFKYMRDYYLIGKVNGILLDLGVSRFQLEHAERGFSFLRDGPLDMRMDLNCGLSASEWLRKASLEKIIWVLKTFGEEKFSRQIARSIVSYRKCGGALTRTHELVKLITHSIPFYDQRKHPATRTFQAIRVYINNELEEIKKVLSAALSVLAPGGRLLVISFHSLEDRIVKCFIRQNSVPLLLDKKRVFDKDKFSEKRIYCYPSFSYSNMKKCFGTNQNNIYLRLNSKVFPSREEIRRNVSARSAILRCIEKVTI